MLFINFSPERGYSLNTYRDSEALLNDDVTGLVEDVVANRPGCCPADGALDALEDGSAWGGFSRRGVDVQPILEDIHALLQQGDFDRLFG